MIGMPVYPAFWPEEENRKPGPASPPPLPRFITYRGWVDWLISHHCWWPGPYAVQCITVLQRGGLQEPIKTEVCGDVPWGERAGLYRPPGASRAAFLCLVPPPPALSLADKNIGGEALECSLARPGPLRMSITCKTVR